MKYIKGNLVTDYLEGRVFAMAHQANCFHTMGAGIAKEIKRRIPELYEVDLLTSYGDKSKLGKITAYKRAFNLYGQFHYGRDKQHTDYESLRKAVITMVEHLLVHYEQLPLTVGVPKLGCGLAGGRWDVVEQILLEVEEEFTGIEFLVYELP